MPNTVTTDAPVRHLDRLDGLRPVMAKAVKKHDEDWRERVGAAVARCFALAGVSQKEAAALINRDPAQVARWISAAERPQLDAIFSAERLRQPLTQALAEMSGAEVSVTVTMRRTA